MAPFTAAQIPDQTGRVMIVTGGNSGIGLETVRQLVNRGARVYIAARSRQRIDDAIAKLKATATGGHDLDLHALDLDLQDLSSVARAAEGFKKQESRLDVLINNAGVSSTLPVTSIDRSRKTDDFTDHGGSLFRDGRRLRTALADQLPLALSAHAIALATHALNGRRTPGIGT